MNLYMMCGAPGSGKSTILKEKVTFAQFDFSCIISRDKIRFSLLKESDEYFSRENETFKIYIDSIQKAIDDPTIKMVFCDATHLTEQSRNKVLNKLDLSRVDKIILLVVHNSLEVCLARNEQREGLEKCPRGVVRRLNYIFEMPSFSEKYGDKYEIYCWIDEEEEWWKFPYLERTFDDFLI